MSLVYVSGAVSQRKNCLLYCPLTHKLLYSVCGRLLIYCPQSRRVVGISSSKTGSDITCVRAVGGDSLTPTYITSHCNGDVHIWRTHADVERRAFKDNVHSVVCLKAHHSGSIECIDAIWWRDSEDTLLIATAGIDGFITLTTLNVDTGETLSLEKHPLKPLVLDIRLVVSGNDIPKLVFGADDSKVHIWTGDGTSPSPLATYHSTCSLSGHKDWVTTLDHTKNGDHTLLASGSKDGSIRVWQLSPKGVASPSSELRVKPVEVGEDEVVVLLTVLTGHTGLISSVRWFGEKVQLVTSAQTEDRSVIVWQSDDEASGGGVWQESSRLGEVGGNREGFFSSIMSPDGTSLFAHSYQGGLHQWTKGVEGQEWGVEAAATGHFKPVVDLSWSYPNGKYLLTCSLDQTTRIHGSTAPSHWSEVCRPQVHGYDMSCVASLGLRKFVSGGEEKILRAFQGPTDLLSALNSACEWGEELSGGTFTAPAATPSLGLSNKSTGGDTEYLLPLSEDSLMAGSLWPEVSKLYGHGHELMCVAATDRHIASACRAANATDANVIIWCSSTFKQLQTLPFHRLTVVQLSFSSTGNRLLACSRDRNWSMFKLGTDDKWSLVSHSSMLEKKLLHTRIIWSLHWLHGDDSFVTGSRDTTVAVWQRGEKGGDTERYDRVATLPQKGEVTAVAATEGPVENTWIIATGLVTGDVELCVFDMKEMKVLKSHPLTPHFDTVRRLAFRPAKEGYLLATCGNDNLVCIHDCEKHL